MHQAIEILKECRAAFVSDGCATAHNMIPMLDDAIAKLEAAPQGDVVPPASIPMLLRCPFCNTRHIDVGEFATKVHHTHACQTCGEVWRPAVVPTVGVQFLPGFKNEE